MRPTFRELDRAECDAILGRNSVGRVAFSLHDRVDIEPISYVHEGTWIYLRTGHGTKVSTVAHNRWVAFEVDEVEGMFEWRSVVVHGAIYRLDPEGAPEARAAYAHAVALLRSLNSEALGPRDAAPFRDIIMRIYVDEVTGRAASTAGE
jgi:nitroimidazol reductase NimA-like FMN-containing flavoprotein (pyridoxamine 5'-phosphate oxidase superfamily)